MKAREKALVALSCAIFLLCVQNSQGRQLRTSSATSGCTSSGRSTTGGPSGSRASASGSASSSGGSAAGGPGTETVITGATTPSCTAFKAVHVGTALQSGQISTAAAGIAAADDQDSATGVLQSIGQSFKAVGGSPAAGATYAQNLATALAEATNSNIDSAALCFGMATTVGGSSQTALARAIATALAGGNTAVALPIKEAMLVTVASYGSFRPTLLEAQTAAGGGGSGEVFKSSLVEFQALSACLTGEDITATSAAKAQVRSLSKGTALKQSG